MAAIELSTAGILFAYGVETTKGTKPAAFTRIYGAKSLPEVNPEPETMETTSLDATEWKTYIDGLKDTGGALQITFNQSEDFCTSWDAVMTAYATAKTAGFSVWWEFFVPGLTKGFFFRGNPTGQGFGGAEQGNVLETSVYVTPTGDIGWATKVEPTPAA